MELSEKKQTQLKWFALGSATTLATLGAWKGTQRVDWRAIRAKIFNLSEEQQIADLLASMPDSKNVEWMRASIEANRNVISIEDMRNFLDPNVPIEQIFEKGKHLGQGAFGSVDLGFNSEGHAFAVKAMRPQMWHHQAIGESDFDIGLSLDHPGIVRVHNLVTKGEMNYMIMEYIPGVTLWDAHTYLSESQKLNLADQLADAICHALERGIMPSDLHGGNMIVTPDGSLKMIDLGLYERFDAIEHFHRFDLEHAFFPLIKGSEKLAELMERFQLPAAAMAA